MIKDTRITTMSKEYKHRNASNVPVTTALKQHLIRIIASKQREICE